MSTFLSFAPFNLPIADITRHTLSEAAVFIDLFSRIVVGWDNAVAESFFHSIKTQMIHQRKFHNVTETEQALFNYIEVCYNRRRKHSTNGYKSPSNYELEYWNNKKAA